MIKLLTIIGARPQIIKAAAISRSIIKLYSNKVTEKILHTGQHYDINMSNIFFEEMGIPTPDYNLNVGSGMHGEQTAKMIIGIERVLLEDEFDGVILYGDTNSTLAGSIAASKLNIPIFHIEAGLRSYNMSMPEEINRIACDHMSSILFTPTDTAYTNLKNEGFTSSPAIFRNGKKRVVENCGDIMYDNSVYFSSIAENNSDILEKYNLDKNNYILATVHRDNNTDDNIRLSSIFKAIINISNSYNIKVIIPLHPRTSKLLCNEINIGLLKEIEKSKNIILAKPVSFLEMIYLEKNSKLIITDSGGVQKEAYFFKKPSIILRPETEWLEIIDNNAAIIADADYERITKAYELLSKSELSYPNLFGDGNASCKIIEKIITYLS
ncbi:MAG: non-hydrolyzing UDP-N-acetylglucosamine 2-epimerase [Bacteroidales bacterium]